MIMMDLETCLHTKFTSYEYWPGRVTIELVEPIEWLTPSQFETAKLLQTRLLDNLKEGYGIERVVD